MGVGGFFFSFFPKDGNQKKTNLGFGKQLEILLDCHIWVDGRLCCCSCFFIFFGVDTGKLCGGCRCRWRTAQLFGTCNKETKKKKERKKERKRDLLVWEKSQSIHMDSTCLLLSDCCRLKARLCVHCCARSGIFVRWSNRSR